MITAENTLIEDATLSELHTLRRHAEAVVDQLPAPGVRFSYANGLAGPVELERHEPLHSQLRAAGHIQVVEAVEVLCDDNRQVYAVPEEVHDQAQQYLSDGYTPCPCGHRGLHNRRDDTGYECGWSECDRVFSRSEVVRND
jgi:hypothetical protein